jgi:hypothetical protein
MKNKNRSNLDHNQVVMHMFDSEHDAQRVIIVGGDSAQIAESIKESLKDLKVEISQDKVVEAIQNIKMPDYTTAAVMPQQAEVRIERIEVPTIIQHTEYKTIEIEKPIYITETKTVEIPVVVPEVKIIEVEKQVIVVEQKIVDSSSSLVKALLVIQTIAILFSLFLRK